MATANRTRVRRSVNPVAKLPTVSLKKRLEEIAELHLARAKLDQEISEAEAKLAAGMEANKLDRLEVDIAVADYKPPRSNAKNIVDPKGFRNAVRNDDDFFASISVSITNAKKVLSGKELAAITTTIPAQVKPPVLKVKLKD